MDNGTAKQLDQAVDRLRIAGADIEALAADRAAGGSQERLRDIGHIDEVASLSPVPDDRKWPTGKFLAKEYAEHRSVDAGCAHPRAIGIEDADRVHRQPID